MKLILHTLIILLLKRLISGLKKPFREKVNTVGFLFFGAYIIMKYHNNPEFVAYYFRHNKHIHRYISVYVVKNNLISVVYVHCTHNSDSIYSKIVIINETTVKKVVAERRRKDQLVDIFVSKKLQFNNEKYSQGEWKKLGWHNLFDVSNHIQGSFSS